MERLRKPGELGLHMLTRIEGFEVTAESWRLKWKLLIDTRLTINLIKCSLLEPGVHTVYCVRHIAKLAKSSERPVDYINITGCIFTPESVPLIRPLRWYDEDFLTVNCS